MDPLDTVLARLAQRPDPASLAGFDAGVMARLAATPAAGPTPSRRLAVWAVVLALGAGVLGGGLGAPRVSERTADAGTNLVNPGMAMAPSTLLAGL